MVGRDRLALARLAVDLDRDDTFPEARRGQQVVDAHPEVLVEVAGAVVPPGVAAGLGMVLPIDVDQPPAAEPRERVALRRGNVGPAVADLRVPHVDVFGRVEIATEGQRFGRVCGLREPAREAVEPGELGLVEGGADDPSVRRVHAHDAEAAARRRDHPRLGERLVVADVRGSRRGAAADRSSSPRHRYRSGWRWRPRSIVLLRGAPARTRHRGKPPPARPDRQAWSPASAARPAAPARATT